MSPRVAFDPFKLYEPQTLGTLLHNSTHCCKTLHLLGTRPGIIVFSRVHLRELAYMCLQASVFF